MRVPLKTALASWAPSINIIIIIIIIIITLMGGVNVMSIVSLTKVVTLTARDCMSSRTVIRALPSLLDYCWLTHYNSSTSMS